jgi:Tfp pilus assembly protein PilE
MSSRRIRVTEDCHAESGLTLVELLVTFTLMGILGFVVSSTFLLAIQLAPDTQARATLAASSGFFVDTLSDDVANATAFGPDQYTSAGSSTPNCVLNQGTNGYSGLQKFTFSTTDYAEYYAVLSPSDQANDPAHLMVKIFRREKTGSAIATTVVLDGYCKTGLANQLVASYNDPTYKIDLYLQPRSTDETRHTSLSADRRTLPPPP